MELWVGRALVIPSGGGSPGPHRAMDRGCGLCQRGDGSLKQCPGLTPHSCCGHTARAGTGHGQHCHSSLQTEPSNTSRARMRPGARYCGVVTVLSPALPELAPGAEAAWACSVRPMSLLLELPSPCGALLCPALLPALLPGQLCLIPARWVGAGLGLRVRVRFRVSCALSLWAHANTPMAPQPRGSSTAGLRPHCCFSQSRCPHRLFFPHETGILLGTGERRSG